MSKTAEKLARFSTSFHQGSAIKGSFRRLSSQIITTSQRRSKYNELRKFDESQSDYSSDDSDDTSMYVHVDKNQLKVFERILRCVKLPEHNLTED